MYITVVNPQGATMGYDGPYVPISHRVLYDNKQFHGFESVAKLFDSHQSFVDFLQYCIKAGVGANGTFNGVRTQLDWSVDAA
jgi:hypothetical protein